ncbi:polysaccharide biosynthesis/export family protein [Flavisphingomonas formosensis]|uniref:polysaccharide biosynthesis/export family protein n=1 Tax=Flavisphingomonas formosensis TaxID=861534 RepID=UPI0012F7987F|nr:polysaccharide biosynthesis/export family protein [Sphingomonas formosensis]
MRWVLLPLLAALGGCSTMPSAGPSAGNLKTSAAVDIVNVTPQDAQTLAAEANARDKDAIDRALASLKRPSAEPTDLRFAAGDTIDVTVWSFSPAAAASTPGPMPLGSFTIASDGTVALPYIGPITIAGLSLPQAQTAISRRFAAKGILQSPSAVIKPGILPHESILVTGAIGQPKSIPWNPAGITLAQAITEALGDGSALLSQGGDMADSRSAIRLSLLRDAAPAVDVPISVALADNIPLQPRDRIVVQKAPALEVTVLGGGVQKNGVYGFGKPPTLSGVLAQAAGLNGQTANNHAVFVLRQRPGQRPVLYDFAWNRAQGLIASQQFQMQDADLVYVAEAPIVSLQKIINILFQVSLPAQVLK